MNGIESIYTPDETYCEEYLEAFRYAGPTVAVALGVELSSEDSEERLALRSNVISEIIYNRVINGVIGNTVLLSTGGHTGETRDQGSEAEIMLLNMARQLEHLTNDINIQISLYGVDASNLIMGKLQFPREIENNHWAVPVYLDTKASSLIENLSPLSDTLFNHEDTLIVLAAGATRPSALRAKVVADMKFPRSTVRPIRSENGSQLERAKKAILKEGLAGALKETYAAEAAIAILTKLGAEHLLNRITQNRLKKD